MSATKMPNTTFVSQEVPEYVDGSRRSSTSPVPPCLRIGGGGSQRRPSSSRAHPPNAGQRPKLSLDTRSKAFDPVSLGNARSSIANSRCASAAAGATAQVNPSPIRTRDSVEQLTERGYYGQDTNRAAAPWARATDFTPVGYEQAFTPASHRQEYFPSPGSTSPTAGAATIQGLVACLERIATENQEMSEEETTKADPVKAPVRGLERRPATKNRQKSAPARLVERHVLPAATPPRACDAGNPHVYITSVTPEGTRRQTLPKLNTGSVNVSAGREVPTTPRRGSPAPEAYHPKPKQSPTRSNRGRTGSIKGTAAAKAFSKGVGAVKTAVNKVSLGRRTSEVEAHQRNHSSGSRGSTRALTPPLRPGSKGSGNGGSRSRFKKPSYQEPPSLAEYALSQPQASRQVGDEFTGREIADLSPASCELLWRATSEDGRVSEEAREEARLSFTARQQVGLTPEAQASAELTRRALGRTPSTARGRPDRNRREETARSYVAGEKDAAQQMALRDPDRYSGLRRL